MDALAASIASSRLKGDLTELMSFEMKSFLTIYIGHDDQIESAVTFIGMKKNHYLIFELNGKPSNDMIYKNLIGSEVVVRGVCRDLERHVIAFRSTISSIKTLSSWMLFIDYPTVIEQKPLRSSKRFKVDLAVLVAISEQRYHARVIDISVSGCAIKLSDSPVNIALGEEIRIVFDKATIADSCPQCSVANVRERDGYTVLGVRFDKVISIEDNLKLMGGNWLL
ncbi:PilZ domain-containing protein [Vibrio sp. YMD68]|uniref:PilZ domain-containing protein n=1 Tax=Vibrio sp. YMD68 TaxID=3042300 RepID=UPI00249C3832|nr:PilZ domain-containing protein [Vibrio sp. YMD68]WGV98299.1 PilZ domain-containing protein [Vibrio sp. YMD68]